MYGARAEKKNERRAAIPLRMEDRGDWCRFETFKRVRNLLLTRDLGEGWDFFFFQTDCDRSVLDVRD